jgi:hypothetical protein
MLLIRAMTLATLKNGRQREGDRPMLARAPCVSYVSPRQGFEFSDPHPGCVEDEQGEPIDRCQNAMHGEDVLRCRRVEFGLVLAR